MSKLQSNPDHWFDVGDARIPHWQFGDGPDIVCVHGWPLFGATFRHVIPALATRYRVHVIDLPGTGQSVWTASTQATITSHAVAVRTVVDELKLARFAYLAHDSGAAIARFAARNDPRVFALVLGNTEIPRHHPWQLAVYILASRNEWVWRQFMGAMRFGFVRRSPIAFGACFRDPRDCEGEFRTLFVDPLLRSERALLGQTLLVHGLDAAVVDELEQVHREIVAPTLLLWGENDPFFPIDRARAMVSQFKGGAKLEVIPGARLFAHEDHPDTFVSSALRFLDLAR